MKKITAQDNIEAFYHPAVLFLREYDREHGTDYYQTLKVISEENTTQPELAKRLFIHRNTLQYRLERLRELIGTDYEKPEERLRIMLTYRLIQ